MISEEKKKVDSMTLSERRGELVGIAAILLVSLFFIYHQVANTGFFTSGFGIVEAFLFYGAAAVAILASLMRAITGRKSGSRPFELGSAIFWMFTSIWLLVTFPFNFAHLADALPAFLRFALAWVSNDIGWVILLLSTLGSLGTAIFTGAKLLGNTMGRQKVRSVAVQGS